MNYDQWLSAPYDTQQSEAEPDHFSLCHKCNEPIGGCRYAVEYDDEQPFFYHHECLYPENLTQEIKVA